MRLRLTCGICDFDTELDDCTAAQVELQWDLFTSRHTHTEAEVKAYINASTGAGFTMTDDTDDDTEGTAQ
jgi:hypothetical protein